MKKRLEALKKDQNGFTLVELIVVLVILAILAALLVPALLGYIDKAKEAKYLEEARSIYTAIQAVNDENYVKEGAGRLTNVASGQAAINKLVDPTSVTSGNITYLADNNNNANDIHKYYTVSTINDLIFTSQDGSTITADMAADGTWTIKDIVKTATPATPETPETP